MVNLKFPFSSGDFSLNSTEINQLIGHISNYILLMHRSNTHVSIYMRKRENSIRLVFPHFYLRTNKQGASYYL